MEYAFGRADLDEGVDRNVVFVDAGYDGVQACVARVQASRIDLVSHAFSANTGGSVSKRSLSLELVIPKPMSSPLIIPRSVLMAEAIEDDTLGGRDFFLFRSQSESFVHYA